MTNIFQNKYRRRILARIAELEPWRDEARAQLDKIKQNIDPKQYAHWWSAERMYNEKIQLLKGLLK